MGVKIVRVGRGRICPQNTAESAPLHTIGIVGLCYLSKIWWVLSILESLYLAPSYVSIRTLEYLVSSRPHILIGSGDLCEYSLAFFTRFVFTHRSRKHVTAFNNHISYTYFWRVKKSRQLACRAQFNLVSSTKNQQEKSITHKQLLKYISTYYISTRLELK